MNAANLIAYKLNVTLTGYLPIPRELIDMGLPSTAVLLYGALLDRATLSQKNRYADENGWVYVIYPVEKLAEAFHLSDRTVKRNLRELEQRGLICRRQRAQNEPSRIYLYLPSGSCKELVMGTNCPDRGSKMSPWRGRKSPPNNKRKQLEYNNYYQHGEDESL